MTRFSRRGLVAAAAGFMLAAFAPISAAQAATIATTYQQQQTQSWCSAAASRIALSAAGILPSQAALASDLGLSGGSGLQDPYAIARVLNKRLGISQAPFRYKLSQDMATFDDAINYGVSVNKPVVYNVVQVAGQSYAASGHYITITGRRVVGTNSVEYRISDPDSPARTGNWYKRSDVKSWNKFGRYTSYGYPG